MHTYQPTEEQPVMTQGKTFIGRDMRSSTPYRSRPHSWNNHPMPKPIATHCSQIPTCIKPNNTPHDRAHYSILLSQLNLYVNPQTAGQSKMHIERGTPNAMHHPGLHVDTSMDIRPEWHMGSDHMSTSQTHFMPSQVDSRLFL